MGKHVSQQAPKRGKGKKILWIVIGVFVIAGLAEFILHPDKYLDSAKEPSKPIQTVEPTEAPTPEPTEAAIQKTPYGGYWQNNPLDAFGLSYESMRDLYDDADAALQKAYETDIAPDASAEEAKALEDACLSPIADKYGVSLEDLKTIKGYAELGYLYDIDPNSIDVLYGDTESVYIFGTTIIVKAKISPSYNDGATVDQNFFNVEDLILNQNCNLFHKISYWAVADMTDGTENKVISFDVNRDLIKAVFDQNVVAITMGDYVTDLWLHQSLR